MAIWIIRHGETAGNANRVVQVPETPLSERGISQAALLGKRLEERPISRILASDYSRAAMTAHSVSESTGVDVELEPLLRERNFGDLRGRRYDEIEIDLFAPDFAPPNGEDWAAFRERVASAWQTIRDAASQSDGDLAVVTHGLVLYALTEQHVMLDAGEEPAMGFGNTSVTIVQAAAPWRVELLNCTAHLDSAARSDRKSISGI